nr:LacI family DNA-binding transcriptional regulator [Nakamurella flava]
MRQSLPVIDYEEDVIVTVKDVAQRAGVSVASVSRALNGLPGVSESVVRRVKEAADELHYRPNAVARSLRTEASRALGLVISDVTNSFFVELARTIEDEAAKLGFSLILCNSDEDPAKEGHYLDVLHDQRIDGLLLSPARAMTPQIRRMREFGTPIVLLDRNLRGSGLPCAGVDGRSAIADLAEHLAEQGYRSAGVIGGPVEVSNGHQRLLDFATEAGNRGIAVAPEHRHTGNFEVDGGRAAMSLILDTPSPPQVVFATNNLMALGALQVLHEQGVAVGTDMGFVSFDDVPWFSLMTPSITAIEQPIAALGANAASMITGLIAGQRVRSRTVRAHLTPRQSTMRGHA